MMSIVLIVLNKASRRSLLVIFIVGLITVGIGDCKVLSIYPYQISSKEASLVKSEVGIFNNEPFVSYSWSYWCGQK